MSQNFHPNRQDFNQYMVPVFAPAQFIPVRGEGSRLWDQAGKEYIDFAGGIAVNALGHAHPVAVKALVEQGQKLWHIGNGYTNEPVLNLAKQLVESTFADKVFFCNSGAEANEAALKLARKVGLLSGSAHKNKIVAFQNAFHGRTLFTVTAGGQPKYSQDFAPLPEGIQHLPFNDLDAARAAIDDETCAVIVEPIQGEGGVITATPEFLKGLRELCDQHGAVLIFDEVQTGIARTGKWFAHQHENVKPDVMTLAKGLGSGVPVGAILTSGRATGVFPVGAHGTTFGGNPLAMAAGLATVAAIEADGLAANAERQGEAIKRGLNLALKDEVLAGDVRDIRGLGLMIGIELDRPCSELVKLALNEGMLINVTHDTVVRLLPPLVFTDSDSAELVDRLSKLIKKFLNDVL